MLITVYAIKNAVNNKVYIGSTQSLAKRFANHKYDLRNNIHKSAHLQNAWNKYSESAFLFLVLEENIDPTNRFVQEQHYMDKYQSYCDTNGYNINSQAETALGRKWSQESRDKITGSKNHRFGQVPWNKNKKLPSSWNKGKRLTKEHREKLSLAKRGKKPAFMQDDRKLNKFKQQLSEARTGENNPQAKLNWHQVEEIRQLYEQGLKQKDLAKKYHVGQKTISLIVNYKAWKS